MLITVLFSVYLATVVVRTDAFLFISPKTVHASRLRAADSEDPSGIFRPDSGPYVPSGLTAEQYQQMKREEAEKVRKMDFGAWGPRFKRSDRPDGDWLLQPKLWSTGFSINNDDKSDQSFTAMNNFARTTQRVQAFLTRNMQPFALLIVWFHVVLSAIRVTRSASSLRASALTLFTFPRLQCSCILGASIVFSPLAARWLEWASRRRLWTSRRMTTVSASFSLMAFAVWSATVVGIRMLIL